MQEFLDKHYLVTPLSHNPVDFSRAEQSDIVLFHCVKPGPPETSLCRLARLNNPGAVIIIVSQQSPPHVITHFLNIGADIFISEPYNEQVFIARIEALLRRRTVMHPLRYRDLQLNPSTHEAAWQQATLKLRRKSFGILWCLLEHAGSIVTKNEIAETVWKEETPSNNAIEVTVKELRDKLRSLSPAISIRTAYGLGYQLTIEDR